MIKEERDAGKRKRRRETFLLLFVGVAIWIYGIIAEKTRVGRGMRSLLQQQQKKRITLFQTMTFTGEEKGF